MGTHICFVRSTNLDEWKPKEIEAMKNGGNVLINKLFEASLTKKQADIVKPNKDTELDPRSHFIYDKYQHRKWYDAKLAQDKSLFAVNGTKEKRVSSGEFDDFFALRTKSAASDSWHESNEDSFDDFNPRVDMKPFPKINSKGSRDFNNSISAMSGLESDPFNPDSPTKFSSSARGGLSFTRTPKASGPDGRRELMKTLQRLDSKREILNTIRDFNIDQDDHLIHPRDVMQSDRRKKGRSSKGNEEPLDSDDRRRMPTDGDVRLRTRQAVSLHGSESTGSSGRRPAPGRTKSYGSDDGLEKPRRRGSDDGDARPRVSRTPSGGEGSGAPSRRQLPSRTKSIGSEDSSSKPRRRVQRTPSDDSQSLQEQSDLKEAAGRPKREPRRGVGRTRSMGADSDHTSMSKTTTGSSIRARSTKRGVRRTPSTDENSLDGSMQSYDADTSQISARATATRRPPRRPRTPVGIDLEDEEEVKPLNDNPSSRRTRTDERSRRRSPKKPSSEGSSSRTPSPSGPPSTRQRSRTTPESNDTNPISVRRVHTVRDRSPMKTGVSPPPTGKRPVPVNLSEDVGRLFASS